MNKRINKIIKETIPERIQSFGKKPSPNNLKWLKRLMYLFGGGFFIIVIAIISLFFLYGRDLPDGTSLKDYNPPVTSTVYASDGKLMIKYSRERRIFMPIDSIPLKLQQAFLAAEDEDFYIHTGVNPIAMARAMIKNIWRIINGQRAVGASTITQQVARQFFLTNERTILRKIKEAILATRIEQALSKKQILEIYLNQIYLGRGSYGVASASLTYFNTSPNSLNNAQIAYLAGLPKAPSNYHPIRNKKRATERRNWVLNRMYDEGYITENEMEIAKTKPLDAMQGKRLKTIEADYFLEETRRTVLKKYSDKTLYNGGLIIHSTLRSDYQKTADTALKAGLIKYDRRHGYRGEIVNLAKYEITDRIKRFKRIPVIAGALPHWKQALVLEVKNEKSKVMFKDGTEFELPFKSVKWARKYYKKRPGSAPKKMGDVLEVGDVIMLDKQGKNYILTQVPLINGAMIVMDPHTGRILAMVGGWDFAISKFNRATQAKRQPGSSVKPFVYLTALDNGKTPAHMILDAPFSLTLHDGTKWNPQNFSKKFFGNSIMRVGIEKSRNLMTVRLANEVGMKKVAKTLRDFDIIRNPPEYLSYALGAGETTLLKMVTAYSMVVNGGKKIEPSLIDRIQDRYGKIKYKHYKQQCTNCSILTDEMPKIPDTRKKLINPIPTYQLVTMLEGVVDRGTGKALKELKIPMGGKTGTTNDNKDAWFIAVTPDLVVGTFLGFDNPRGLGSQPPNEKYNWWRQETAASVAVPTIKEFFVRVKDKLPAQPFRIPEGVKFVNIDKRTGEKSIKKNKHTMVEAFIPGTEPKSKKQNQQNEIGLDDVY